MVLNAASDSRNQQRSPRHHISQCSRSSTGPRVSLPRIDGLPGLVT